MTTRSHHGSYHSSGWFSAMLVAAALIWRLIYAYWTLIARHAMVPPGDDAVVHVRLVNTVLTGKLALSTGSYPLGFHVLVGVIGHFLHWNGLASVLWLGPLLLVLPIPIIFLVGYKLFSNALAGAVAACAWAILALAPVRAFGDGNYPDLLAGSVIVPLAILAAYKSVVAPNAKHFLWLVASLLAVTAVHHLSTVFVLIIVAPWLFFIMIQALVTHRHQKRTRWMLITVLASSVIVGVAAWYAFGHSYTTYVHALFSTDAMVHLFGAAAYPISLLELLELHNPLVVILGLVGLAAVVLSKLPHTVKSLLLSWIFVLLLLSVLPISGLPGRFARELAIPFCLCIGFLASFIYTEARHLRRGWIGLLIIILTLGNAWLASFKRPFALPDPFLPLMRVSPPEDQAVRILETITPVGSTILANNGNPYLDVLVSRHVKYISSVTRLDVYLRESANTTVYIGARPPLTPESVYPFYSNYDAISAAMAALPGLKLEATLSNGTKIYRVLPPAN